MLAFQFKKFSFFILISAALLSCKTAPHETTSPDDAFNQYKESFIEDLWKHYPVMASSVGYHRYDSMLVIPDNSSIVVELTFAKNHLDELGKIDENALSVNNRTDYLMIRDQLNLIVWSLNSYKAHEWNPASYNITGPFAEMLNGRYGPLENRLRNFHMRMKYVPAYYEAAKTNIKNPTLEHTQLAIEQNLGGVTVFAGDLKKALDTAKLEEDEKKEILARAQSCSDAVKGYADWLRKLNNPQPRSFRLGKELHSQKFDLEIQSSYSADSIYSIAVAHKKDLHKKMVKVADELWPKYMGKAAKPADTLKLIRAVIDKISLKHVQRDSFQLAIEKQIPELTEFVKQKDLIYVDTSKPLVVRKEPAYMAGVAGASISAPGPYDKNANTYYNVGSLNGWTSERAESYLREYNHYALQILNIHEAIPGHYAQAEGKWRRVSLTQVQLCSYFTGFWEIYQFREELKKTMGDKFNLKQFHEKFLGYGSAPVKYIRQMYRNGE